MRDSWEYELAKELKVRNNKVPIGPCIGKIEALEPEPVITIQNGTYRLNNDQIYVCYQILERWTSFQDFITKDGAATLSGTILHPNSSHDFITKSSTLRCDVGQVRLEEVWKKGDWVLVIPAENEQTFFIVDVLRPLKRSVVNNVPF